MEYNRKTISASDPPGARVVHNFPPGRPGRRFGDDGFRYWVTVESQGHRCFCGWVDGEHYGTARWVDADGEVGSRRPVEGEVR
jgi:hypothetical protein